MVVKTNPRPSTRDGAEDDPAQHVDDDRRKKSGHKRVAIEPAEAPPEVDATTPVGTAHQLKELRATNATAKKAKTLMMSTLNSTGTAGG